MEFRQCSIMGNKYVEKNGMLMRALDDSALHLQPIEQFTVRYHILFTYYL